MRTLKEIEPSELTAARSDEIERPCEACGATRAINIVDRRWLCSHCAFEYLRTLEGERPRGQEQMRSTGFGGSDAGVLAGVDPYRDPFALVMEKKGELEPLPPSERMEAGQFFERGVLDFYQYKTGRRIRYLNVTHRHPLIPIMLATPDALCLDEKRGVDAKLTGIDQAPRWQHGPPLHMVAQMQWYMRFFDYPLWDIARWDGSQLHIYTIEADRPAQDALLYIAQTVWDRYVIGDELPIIGTSEGSERYLKQHFPRNKTDAMRMASDKEEGLLDAYNEVRKDYDFVSKSRAEIENAIKLAIGDDEGIYSPVTKAKFTWKKAKDSNICDWQTLATTLLNGLTEKHRKALIEEYTTKQEGTRRIHWTPAKA